VLAIGLGACSSASEKGASAVTERLRARLDAEGHAHPPADRSFQSMARVAAAVNEQSSLAEFSALCPGKVAYSLSALPGKVAINATSDGASARAEWEPA
jgi:hypothetical protein